jgi:glutathione S-transferase
MQLIGMLDSPYVRRVAVSMLRLGVPFERHDWSVGADFERIRKVSPLGRVPVLVLEDGTALVESGAILDALDDLVGPSRALLPATGTNRREALRAMSLAIAAGEKARDAIYERTARPPEKYHEPWATRCREQMLGAVGELEVMCARRGPSGWLVDDRLTQADVTTGCMTTFLHESLEVFGNDAFPRLAAHREQCEALPEFRALYAPWFAPGMKKP